MATGSHFDGEEIQVRRGGGFPVAQFGVLSHDHPDQADWVAVDSRLSAPDFDFFISYSGEDRDIAEPLAHGLQQRGYVVWWDGFEISPGDSLRRMLDEGLRGCRFGVVILSPAFFQRDWPQMELDALFAREAAESRSLVVPIVHTMTTTELTTLFSPLLGSRICISTADGLDRVVAALAEHVGSPSGRVVSDPLDVVHDYIEAGSGCSAVTLEAVFRLAAETVADGDLVQRARELAGSRETAATLRRDDFEALQSLGRRIVSTDQLEQVLRLGFSVALHPDFIATAKLARMVVYDVFTQEFLVALKRRGLNLSATVVNGDVRYATLDLPGLPDDLDGDRLKLTRRLLVACYLLLDARPSIYFPFSELGSAAEEMPQGVIAITYDYLVELRALQEPQRVVASLRLEHLGREVALVNYHGRRTLAVLTSGSLLAWSPWLDGDPVARLDADPGHDLISAAHRDFDGKVESTIISDAGIVGQFMDWEIFSTWGTHSGEYLHDIVWHNDALLGVNRGQLCLVNRDLEVVASQEWLIEAIRALPDPDAKVAERIGTGTHYLRQVNYMGDALLILQVSFDVPAKDMSAVLLLKRHQATVSVGGWFVADWRANCPIMIPSDSGRHGLLLTYNRAIGGRQEAPLRWYRPVETAMGIGFVEAGRAPVGREGLFHSALVDDLTAIVSDIEGQVYLAPLDHECGPTVLSSGKGSVRGISVFG